MGFRRNFLLNNFAFVSKLIYANECADTVWSKILKLFFKAAIKNSITLIPMLFNLILTI